MRYKLAPDGSTLPAQNTGNVVELTVWFTLLCGIALLWMGIHGRQRWLQFWGGLTVLCCGVYFFRAQLGIDLPG